MGERWPNGGLDWHGDWWGNQQILMIKGVQIKWEKSLHINEENFCLGCELCVMVKRIK